MSTAVRQVVKLGGSLLDYAELESQWWRWLASCPNLQTIVVVGGGAAVEELRTAQHSHDISDIDAHWRAIAAMGDNARRLANRLSSRLLALPPADTVNRPGPIEQSLSSPNDGRVVTRLKELTQSGLGSPLVFVDPLPLLRCDEPAASGDLFPCSWEVTSDSIAARIAELLDCPELTLLKSALPGASRTYSAAAAARYVDAYFPMAAASLGCVQCVNLRSPQLTSQMLLPG